MKIENKHVLALLVGVCATVNATTLAASTNTKFAEYILFPEKTFVKINENKVAYARNEKTALEEFVDLEKEEGRVLGANAVNAQSTNLTTPGVAKLASAKPVQTKTFTKKQPKPVVKIDATGNIPSGDEGIPATGAPVNTPEPPEVPQIEPVTPSPTPVNPPVTPKPKNNPQPKPKSQKPTTLIQKLLIMEKDGSLRLSANAKSDIKNNVLKLNAKRGAVIISRYAISKGIKPYIKVIKSGHSRMTISGNVSHHYYGRAIDIYNVRGAKTILSYVKEHRNTLKVNELIFDGRLIGKPANYYNLKHGKPYSYSEKVLSIHKDHIHISFE